jgi:hypothetical protein
MIYMALSKRMIVNGEGCGKCSISHEGRRNEKTHPLMQVYEIICDNRYLKIYEYTTKVKWCWIWGSHSCDLDSTTFWVVTPWSPIEPALACSLLYVLPKRLWTSTRLHCVTFQKLIDLIFDVKELKETGWDSLDRIHLAHDRVQLQALVNTVMNLQGP